MVTISIASTLRYGHGFELYAVASSPQGNLVASASKATKQEYAAIRLWDTSSWKQVGVLPHHTLTVTQLAFSSGGDRLLAVSRDRCWSLWKQLDKKENGGFYHVFCTFVCVCVCVCVCVRVDVYMCLDSC